MRRNIVVAIGAVILAIAGVACRRSSTYTVKDGSLTVEQKGKDAGSMTFTGKNGETVAINMNGGKVPETTRRTCPFMREQR